jgi:hypothetical protein
MTTHTHLDLGVVPVVRSHVVKVLFAVGLLSVSFPLRLLLDTRPVLASTPPLESALLVRHGHDAIVKGHIRSIGRFHHAEQEPSRTNGVLDTRTAIPEEPAFAYRMPRHLEIDVEIVETLTERCGSETRPKSVGMPEVEALLHRGYLANRNRRPIASDHP